MKDVSAAKDILFEIGSEELPATNLADIFESGGENVLETRFRKVFEDKRIALGRCRVWATPRRLVFLAEGVAPAQSAKDNLTRLMAKSEAYDAEGRPAEKFATILKHRNASLSETIISEQNGKEYVFLKKQEPVAKTAALLPEILEALVRSLPFPKNMKWDDSGVYFPRPIRNALCFYGDKPLRFKIGGTRSSADTVFFSKSRRTRASVKDIPSYFATLKKHGVILDPVERKKSIAAILEKLSASHQGKIYEDLFLLNEVNFLVENPCGVSAPFGEEFLKLPLEVLTVSMARKQRIFGLVDKKGGVMPKFLAVLDGEAKEKQKRAISLNMENILHAKLQDSLFFYQEDVKIPLEKKREELKNLIFLKGAGSMLEKSDRLVRLAKDLKTEAGLSDKEAATLERAAYLCKADLLTQMVGEFPELQGIMGKYYAIENGESAEVAQAIGEQYLPRTVQDRLPESKAGALLSVLDKCDLVIASFELGNEPSSSADPFGLRRSASAVLKILIEKEIPLSLRFLIRENKKAEAFFKDRFKALLADKGYREDLAEAVLAARFDSPHEAHERLRLLSAALQDEAFAQALKVVERTANILKGYKEALPETIDETVFTEDLERAVFARYNSAQAGIREAARSRDFRRATSLYAGAFFAILIEFFEKVFVNAEDMQVRRNRLALLRAVNRLYSVEVADLSKIRNTS